MRTYVSQGDTELLEELDDDALLATCGVSSLGSVTTTGSGDSVPAATISAHAALQLSMLWKKSPGAKGHGADCAGIHAASPPITLQHAPTVFTVAVAV
jgi:hypothetical protein